MKRMAVFPDRNRTEVKLSKTLVYRYRSELTQAAARVEVGHNSKPNQTRLDRIARPLVKVYYYHRGLNMCPEQSLFRITLELTCRVHILMIHFLSAVLARILN